MMAATQTMNSGRARTNNVNQWTLWVQDTAGGDEQPKETAESEFRVGVIHEKPFPNKNFVFAL